MAYFVGKRSTAWLSWPPSGLGPKGVLSRFVTFCHVFGQFFLINWAYGGRRAGKETWSDLSEAVILPKVGAPPTVDGWIVTSAWGIDDRDGEEAGCRRPFRCGLTITLAADLPPGVEEWLLELVLAAILADSQATLILLRQVSPPELLKFDATLMPRNRRSPKSNISRQTMLGRTPFSGRLYILQGWSPDLEGSSEKEQSIPNVSEGHQGRFPDGVRNFRLVDVAVGTREA